MATSKTADALTALVSRWKADLPAYAATQLHLQDKADTIRLCCFNPAQRELHRQLEEQRAATGQVRALILKARQMGASTYVAMRFLRDLLLAPKDAPARGYVLAHDDKTAKKLLRMYSLAWENHDPNLRVGRTRSNDHEVHWANGSMVETNTASTPTGGRGGTVTRFHGSEVAHWQHAEAHALGSFQQLSKQPGTEMILESTANGAVGAFYERWRSAELGRNGFLPVFLPWTILPEYAVPVPPGFALSTDKPNDVLPSEVDYAALYGVSMEQMAYRRMKVEEFAADGSDGALRFAQEYPIEAAEAFLGGAGQAFIGPAVVEAARKRPTVLVGVDAAYPLVMGLDPAPQHGGASSALVWRKGRICYRIERLRGLDPENLAMRVYREFMDAGAERLCVDESEGVGHSVVTHLQRLAGTGGKVVGVKFGAASHDQSLYQNMRAQIWSKMAAWLADGAAIPDELAMPGQPTLASELLSVQRVTNNERRVQVEKKAEVVKRLGVSPDGADALACTFVYPDPSNAHVAWTAATDYSDGGLASTMTARRSPDDAYTAPMGTEF